MPLGFDAHRDGRLARLGVECDLQPFVGEQRRIDAAGEVAQGFERFVGVAFDLRDRGQAALGIAVEQHLGQPQLHLEGHQVLLGAVVEVALELAPLLVLRCDQPLTRGSQLLKRGPGGRC